MGDPLKTIINKIATLMSSKRISFLASCHERFDPIGHDQRLKNSACLYILTQPQHHALEGQEDCEDLIKSRHNFLAAVTDYQNRINEKNLSATRNKQLNKEKENVF